MSRIEKDKIFRIKRLSTVRTVDYDIQSINLENLIKFVQMNGTDPKQHQNYFIQIINYYTTAKYKQYSKDLSEVAKFYTLRQQQFVFQKGQTANKAYIILYGSVQIKRNEQNIFYYHSGDCFGDEQIYFNNENRSSSARISDGICILCEIQYNDYRKLFEKKIKFVQKYLSILQLKCRFFKDLQFQTVVYLLKQSKLITYQKGDTIIDEGDRLKGIYIILEGSAKQLKQTVCQNKKTIFNEISKKDFKDFQQYVKTIQSTQTENYTRIEQKIYGIFDSFGLKESMQLNLLIKNRIQANRKSKILYLQNISLKRHLKIRPKKTKSQNFSLKIREHKPSFTISKTFWKPKSKLSNSKDLKSILGITKMYTENSFLNWNKI